MEKWLFDGERYKYKKYLGIFSLQETCLDTDFVSPVQNSQSLPPNYELVVIFSTKSTPKRDFFLIHWWVCTMFYLYASHTDKKYLICIEICMCIHEGFFCLVIMFLHPLIWRTLGKWILNFFLKYSLGRGK